MKRHIEHEEQKKLFIWAKYVSVKYPALGLMFAIPNESYGSGRQAIIRGAYFKAEGRKRGVPDIFLPVPKNGFCGLFIEMKKPKQLKPTITKEQRQWIDALSKQGYRAVVCYGFEEARRAICEYLGIEA